MQASGCGSSAGRGIGDPAHLHWLTFARRYNGVSGDGKKMSPRKRGLILLASLAENYLPSLAI
jgi:hypothetical protein